MKIINKKITDLLIHCRSNNNVIPVKFNGPLLRNEEEAYATQYSAHKECYSKDLINGPVIGRKIGCTTKVMQDYLKIPNPCAGRINKKNVYKNNASLNFKNYIQAGVECEIGIILKHDMSYNNYTYSDKEILNSISSIFPAIEIVDNRYENWENTDTNTLIADDFFSAGCVMGNPIKMNRNINLNKLHGTMKINNTIVGGGYGKDILGNPINALKWILSRKDIINGILPKNSFILLGSIVQTKWIGKGDKIEIFINDLGSVTTQFI